MQANRIYFAHFREQDQEGQYINNSGATFAWRAEKNGQVTIGKPAVCWKSDVFRKDEGRRIALENLNTKDAYLVLQSPYVQSLAAAQSVLSMNFPESMTPSSRDKLFEFMSDEISNDITAVMTTGWFENLLRVRFRLLNGHLREFIAEAENEETIQMIRASLVLNLMNGKGA